MLSVRLRKITIKLLICTFRPTHSLRVVGLSTYIHSCCSEGLPPEVALVLHRNWFAYLQALNGTLYLVNNLDGFPRRLTSDPTVLHLFDRDGWFVRLVTEGAKGTRSSSKCSACLQALRLAPYLANHRNHVSRRQTRACMVQKPST